MKGTLKLGLLYCTTSDAVLDFQVTPILTVEHVSNHLVLLWDSVSTLLV